MATIIPPKPNLHPNCGAIVSREGGVQAQCSAHQWREAVTDLTTANDMLRWHREHATFDFVPAFARDF